MQSDNKLFSDLARLGQSAAGTLHGAKAEVKNQIKGKLENALQDMDLVSREEFDVVREMAVAAREENAELRKRIDALEKVIAKKKKK
ncbi:MAG: accessory factor UbiK family protein [Kordiimonadaceae bacterium]|nr:accessory factor UbiK family protein [Kordiimonadaceae bacterium]MBT6036030.1 accessory factor UbiK family protein [Kordiimonadaceae bacterium]